MAKALIVVDVQNDFCEGGSLAVAGGAEVAFRINGLIHAWYDAAPAEREYDVVVATQDHHIEPGDHFSSDPDFVDSWPEHCVVGTDGAAFHPNLDPQPFDEIFRKGEHAAAYSGFEGVSPDGTPLDVWLRERDVHSVDICGIATDYCVRSTALDARRQGFTTRVLTDLVAGVHPDSSKKAFDDMREAEVTLV